jgi:hypothetical protein
VQVLKTTIMKKLIPILLLISCSKETPQQAAENSLTATQEVAAITEETVNNLYIPEDEGGWDSPYPSGRVGLWNGSKSIAYTTVGTGLFNQYGGTVPLGSKAKVCYYDCLIANGTPGETWDTTINNPITRSGTMDFVTNLGVQAKPLGITVYANGGVFLGRKKDEFAYSPTHSRTGAARGVNYSGKSFIWHGWGDNYNNTAIIPDYDGKFVIAVTLDYGATNPKTSLLPIRVTGMEVVVDTSAIGENAALPATNYKAVIQRGRNKGVLLSWEGDSYAYCIEKWIDGAWKMIIVWYDGRSFLDVDGTFRDKYRVVSRNQGRIPDVRTNEIYVTKR